MFTLFPNIDKPALNQNVFLTYHINSEKFILKRSIATIKYSTTIHV